MNSRTIHVALQTIKRFLYGGILPLILLVTGCTSEKNVQQYYTNDVVFDEADAPLRETALRSEQEKESALSATIVPIKELPGYYIHFYELPYMDENEKEALETDNNLRTVSTETSSLQDFRSFGLKANRGTDVYSLSFGANEGLNTSKMPDGKWHPEEAQTWPGENFEMKFFAISNENNSPLVVREAPVAGNLLPQYTVALSPDYTQQPDIIASMTQKYAGNFRRPVPIHFDHKMAAFKVIVDDVLPTSADPNNPYDGIEEFRIKELSFKNLVTKATLVGDDNSWVVKEKGDFSYKPFNKDFNGQQGKVSLAGKEGEKEHLFLLFPQDLSSNVTRLTFSCENISQEKINNDFSKLGNIDLGTYFSSLQEGHTYVMKITTESRAYRDVLNVEYTQTELPSKPEGGKINIPFDFTVQSYREFADGSKKRLFWESTFKTENESTYEQDPPGWFSSIKTSLDSTYTDVFNPLTKEEGRGVVFRNRYYISTETNVMKERQPIGTQTMPFNLAKGGQDYSDLGTTANCYVIDAPGWYCFPLVYGNGYKDGQIEEYSLGRAPDFGSHDLGYCLDNLASHVSGKDIKKPYIPEHNKINYPNIYDYIEKNTGPAYLEWQDIPGLISEIHRNSFMDMGGERKEYIVFYIDPETITEGNAVISLKEGIKPGYKETEVSQRPTVWSWHIWVSDIDLRKTVPVKKWSGKEGALLSVPLGYCNGYQIKSEERKVWVKYTAGSKEKTIELIQKGNPDDDDIYGDNMVQYQFGRKDPFVGAQGRGTREEKIRFDEYGNEIPSTRTFDWGIDYGYDLISKMINAGAFFAIKSDKLINYSNSWNWYADSRTTPGAPWYNKLQSEPDAPPEPTTTAENVQKIVYDPCPVGFNMPEVDVFSGFTMESASPNGFVCNTGVAGVTMTIPILGYRLGWDALFSDYKTLSFYWCSDTNKYWHDRGFYMSVWRDPKTGATSFEKYQYLPPESHKDFPKGRDGGGVIPQISKNPHSGHAPQIMPFKH